ncbi:DNA repair helicase XPB [Candidatus Riflebacteria bacterium]
MDTRKPLIVQSDLTLLLETGLPDFEACRNAINRFSELEKSPEHIHTYKLSGLSIWNAVAAGLNTEWMLLKLKEFARFEIPATVTRFIMDSVARFGFLTLKNYDSKRNLFSFTPEAIEKYVYEEIINNPTLQKLFLEELEPGEILISVYDRGSLKSLLIHLGYPVKDEVGFKSGEPLVISLRDKCRFSQMAFSLRDYQEEAVDTFCANEGGSGVIVLPCGAGKTVVGIGSITTIKQHTLILVTSIVAARQWIRELLDKTNIAENFVGEYTGEKKEVRPITVATYQVLIKYSKKLKSYPHFHIFSENPWGLIIYDEVHLLPAPIFKITSSIQATRRLGLTATLIREDGREKDVFSLIGPKRYDIPWKEMEKKKWISQAICSEIRAPLNHTIRLKYARATRKAKFRIASENPRKKFHIKNLLLEHSQDSVLIIGQFLTQLKEIANSLGFPLITGAIKTKERQVLFDKFKNGDIKVLVVSKVANFAVDLPRANVAIQISGTYGSRQEEAQRLGRILRPKGKNSFFYTLVSKDTVEQEFALKRQLFLTEQGYSYEIIDSS